MSYGIIQHGDLTLIKRENGQEKTIHTGEALCETVSTIHCGENRGDDPVELTVFYASTPGTPLSVQAPQ